MRELSRMSLRSSGLQLKSHPAKPAHDSSALPGSVADAGAGVRLAKCRIAMFDEIEIDGAKCRLRLLQGRAGLYLNEFVFKITARKRGNHLVALLRRVLVIANSHDIHQNPCVGESDFRP